MTPEFCQSFAIDEAQQECGTPWEYSSHMLDQVSRTFALNIKVLPKHRLGRPVLLAYLYCRMADTIEDDPHFDAKTKQTLLNGFALIFSAQGNQRQHLCLSWQNDLPSSWKTSEDPNLYMCAHAWWSIQLLDLYDRPVQAPIIACIEEMCHGMGEFALRQEARTSSWLTIQNEADLDKYCYYVAGVVGILLCDLFSTQSNWITAERQVELRKYAISFGLALQVTNIIKDVGEDSLRKVCFIPEEFYRSQGINDIDSLFSLHADLISIQQKTMQPMIQKAWKHIDDAVRFTQLLPLLEPRIRLFCLWPLLMAAETLVAAGQGEIVFDPTKKLKITRSQVKTILKDSTWHVWSNRWLSKRISQLNSTIPSSEREQDRAIRNQ